MEKTPPEMSAEMALITKTLDELKIHFTIGASHPVHGVTLHVHRAEMLSSDPRRIEDFVRRLPSGLKWETDEYGSWYRVIVADSKLVFPHDQKGS